MRHLLDDVEAARGTQQDQREDGRRLPGAVDAAHGDLVRDRVLHRGENGVRDGLPVGRGGGEAAAVDALRQRGRVEGHGHVGGAVGVHGDLRGGAYGACRGRGAVELVEGGVQGERDGRVAVVGVGDAHLPRARVRCQGAEGGGAGGAHLLAHRAGHVHPAGALLVDRLVGGGTRRAHQRVLELPAAPVGVAPGQDRRRARHVRGRHGRTRRGGVGRVHRVAHGRAGRAGGDDVDAGGGEVGLDAVVPDARAAAGEGGQLVVAVDGAHGQCARRGARGAH